VSGTEDQNAPGAVGVWLVALGVYVVAVFHRSSLAVAGLAAAHRFGISAAQLSVFTVLQLLVYAGMQIPVGLLVDRFGPRRVLTAGAVTLTCAQTAFAFAADYPTALAARAFVGIGDAMTFICVLRLVNTWFAPRRVPLMVQVTGMCGQLGAIGAAVPMTWALGRLGWTHAYLAAASAGLVMTVALVVVVRDAPHARHTPGTPLEGAAIRASLRESWAHPGTRLGFWMHFTTQFSATVLGLLWGYPFFVQGEGTGKHTAGVLLSLMVVAFVAAGPFLGWRTAIRPWQRSTLVLGIVLVIASTWTVVLCWPGHAPVWLLVVLVLVAGVGGPASVVGFDLGRTSNPPARLASATGIINQGGFLASLTLALAIGLILDWRAPGHPAAYPTSAFRWAMSFQYVLWSLGLVQIWRYRIKARAHLRREDPALWAELSGQG